MHEEVCYAWQKLESNGYFGDVEWKSLCQAVYKVTIIYKTIS